VTDTENSTWFVKIIFCTQPCQKFTPA